MIITTEEFNKKHRDRYNYGKADYFKINTYIIISFRFMESSDKFYEAWYTAEVIGCRIF